MNGILNWGKRGFSPFTNQWSLTPIDFLSLVMRHPSTQHDQSLFELMQAIKSMMTPPAPKKRSIGFTADIGGDGK